MCDAKRIVSGFMTGGTSEIYWDMKRKQDHAKADYSKAMQLNATRQAQYAASKAAEGSDSTANMVPSPDAKKKVNSLLSQSTNERLQLG